MTWAGAGGTSKQGADHYEYWVCTLCDLFGLGLVAIRMKHEANV